LEDPEQLQLGSKLVQDRKETARATTSSHGNADLQEVLLHGVATTVIVITTETTKGAHLEVAVALLPGRGTAEIAGVITAMAATTTTVEDITNMAAARAWLHGISQLLLRHLLELLPEGMVASPEPPATEAMVPLGQACLHLLVV
jgi:hypothetical protein